MDSTAWSTQDLYLASTLKTLGANMLCVTLDDMGRWQFNFESHEDISLAVQKYYERTLSVEPNTLFLNMRSLRREAQTNAKRAL
jgi:hypothetical protein